MNTSTRKRRCRQRTSDEETLADQSINNDLPSTSRRSRSSAPRPQAQASHLTVLHTLNMENNQFRRRLALHNKRNQKKTVDSPDVSLQKKRRRTSRQRPTATSDLPEVESRDASPASGSISHSLGSFTTHAFSPSPSTSPQRSINSSDSTRRSPIPSARKKRAPTHKSPHLSVTRKLNPASLTRSVQMSLLTSPGPPQLLLSTTKSRIAANGDSQLFPQPTIKQRNASGSEDNDQYCWLCHIDGSLENCTKCPRAFHLRCLTSVSTDATPSTPWCCPVCCDLENRGTAELTSDKWLHASSEKTADQVLKESLAFLVDFTSIQCWAEPFRESFESLDSIHSNRSLKFPMDLRTLLARVKTGRYKSTHAFMYDLGWVFHTWHILDNNKNKLRLLERLCRREIFLLRACPECYLRRTAAIRVLPATHSVFPEISGCTSHIYLRPSVPSTQSQHLSPEVADGSWLTKPCHIIHPLVWVRPDKSQRFWPGKLLEWLPDGCVIAYIFGSYISQKAAPECVRLHTNAMTDTFDAVLASTQAGGASNSGRRATTGGGGGASGSLTFTRLGSEKTDAEAYLRAQEELRRHVAAVMEAFPQFELPSQVSSLDFDWRVIDKFYKPFNPRLSPPPRSATPSRYTPRSTGNSRFSRGDSPDVLGLLGVEADTPDVVEVDSPLTAPAVSDGDVVPSPVVVIDVDQAPMGNYSEPVLARFSNELQGMQQQQRGLFGIADTSLVSAINPLSTLNSPDNHQLSPPHLLPSSYDDPSIMSENPEVLGFVGAEVEVRTGGVDSPAELTGEKELSAYPSHQQSRCPIDPTEAISKVWFEFTQEMNAAASRTFQTVQDTLRAHRAPEPPLPAELESVGCHTTLLKTKDTECQSNIAASTTSQSTSTSHLLGNTGLIEDQACQIVLLQREIERLDADSRRLRLLVDLSRQEVGTFALERIAEVRKVWEADTKAILVEACRVFEKQANAVIEDVKRKQWCSQCGQEAYFYCCWNTSYCNSICQDLHWPAHMSTCLQANNNSVSTQQATAPQQAFQTAALFGSVPVATASAASTATVDSTNLLPTPSLVLTNSGTSGGATNSTCPPVFVTTNGAMFPT